jgi:hypothetical protein
MAGHCNPGGFDLFGCNPAAFHGLQTVFSKAQLASAGGKPPCSAFLLFSEFYFFRTQHDVLPLIGR